MPGLVILTLAFSPGLFWLWLIYRRDKYRPEPRALVIRTFLLGAAVALPVSLIESMLYPGSTEDILTGPANLATVAYVAFIVAGLTEELGKYLVVRHTIYGSPYFDEPMDGLIYASAAALGFASLENVGYLITYGSGLILVRGPFSTLAHVLFSAMWGYSLGRQKLLHSPGSLLVLLGLIGAVAAHGLFDFLLFVQSGYEPMALLLFVAAGILFLALLSRADRVSPYRDKISIPLVACPSCGCNSSYNANFCGWCATPLAAVQKSGSIQCSVCGMPLHSQDHFCTSCGSRLNKKLSKAPRQ